MTSDKIKSSLIIATYNWKDALELVLKSILQQSKMPFEVIIADDGSKEDTQQLIDNYKDKFPVPLRHIWHEDKGFRLSEIRNKAINISNGNYIIQIDGDIILHKHFVKDHEKFAEKGQFISGSRVLLGVGFSKKILNSKEFEFNIFSKQVKNKHYQLRLPLLANFLAEPTNDINKVITSVRGCNMSFWKNDLIKINGYNEDMTGWGREDSEISARLVNLGLSKINLKFSAIQYHIYHPENSRDSLNINDQILAESIKDKKTFISNGLDKNKIKKPIPKVTAIIPTFNEEQNIEAAIEQVRWADEILVIDSFSNDQTVAIADKLGAKVIQRVFDDFSTQKNYAIGLAKHDWIFILDADERITPDLQSEIIHTLKNNSHYDGFWINRQNFFINKPVKHSGWQNDKVLRLFNRKKCHYNGKLVHEEITCKGDVGLLKSELLHYTFRSYDDYLNKINQYASLKAKEWHRKGIKPNFFQAYIKPAYRFLYHYVITFGFLDGKTGWTIAKINALGMRQRYNELKKKYKK